MKDIKPKMKCVDFRKHRSPYDSVRSKYMPIRETNNYRNSQNYAIEVSYMNSLMQVWILLIKPALTKLSSLIKQENKKTST